MSTSRQDAEPREHDADRGFGEILLTALSSTALVPFVQAIATKAGEDAYAKIRHLIGVRNEPDDEEPLVLVDRRASTILELPRRMSEKDARALATVRKPPTAPTQWLHIRFDPDHRRWTATATSEPPRDAIEIDDPAR